MKGLQLDKRYRHRLDNEMDNDLDQMQKRLASRHLSDLHKKLRTPSDLGAASPEQDMGETDSEGRAEGDQKDLIGEVGHRHHQILKEMYDPGEGMHEEEKANEMKRHDLPVVSPMNKESQHERVYDEEDVSNPPHMLAVHKKKHKSVNP